MTNTRTMYMHTLNGFPASLEPGGQIVVTWPYGGVVRLVATLEQIQGEQRQSDKWRIVNGYQYEEYGYLRVEVPNADAAPMREALAEIVLWAEAEVNEAAAQGDEHSFACVVVERANAGLKQ